MAKKKAARDGSKSKEVEYGKAIAILSYITWIGLIIAIVLNIEKKNEFGKFHIRQALIILIAALLTAIPVIGWIWGVFVFVLWLIGLIAAINGKRKEVPVLGPLAQDWFKGI